MHPFINAHSVQKDRKIGDTECGKEEREGEQDN